MRIPSEKLARMNRAMLRDSEVPGAYAGFVIQGVPTIVMRTGWETYTVSIPEPALSMAAGHEECGIPDDARRDLLDCVVVGGFDWPADRPPRVDPEFRLSEAFADRTQEAADRFATMVDAFGQWPDFADLLVHLVEHDPAAEPPEEQGQLEYWALTGTDAAGQDVLELFVRREDGFMPLYTSSLYAQLAAASYEGRTGMALTPVRIPCVHCLLSGFARGTGAGLSGMALLNEQWEVTAREERDEKGARRLRAVLRGRDGHWRLSGCARENGPVVWIAEQGGPE
ncbi:MAG: hypothetical protein ACLFOY_15940 [Desulfatibacillaceae bacterium]